MSAHPHHIKEIFPETLKECLGIVTATCDKLGVGRRTYYDWRAADPIFAAKCDQVTETTIDFVENQLLKLIKEGKEASTIFYMKTKGKGRGYVERIETTGKDGAAIKSELIVSERGQAIIERYKQQVLDDARLNAN